MPEDFTKDHKDQSNYSMTRVVEKIVALPYPCSGLRGVTNILSYSTRCNVHFGNLRQCLPRDVEDGSEAVGYDCVLDAHGVHGVVARNTEDRGGVAEYERVIFDDRRWSDSVGV